jgi:hypothetical protein
MYNNQNFRRAFVPTFGADGGVDQVNDVVLSGGVRKSSYGQAP